MAVEVRKLDDALGAEVGGLDLLRPIDAGTRDAVYRAFLEHLVLVFRGPALTPQQFMAFARNFGELQPHVAASYRHPEAEDIVMMTNVRADGGFDAVGASRGVGWHSDLAYAQVPAKATLLHALEIPDRGGDTHFANMYRVYGIMPEALRRQLAGRMALFRYGGRTGQSTEHLTDAAKAVPDVIHPAIRLHPETGRPAVYLNPYHTICIVGLPRAESDAVLEEVFALCERPDVRWRHRWRVGDTIIWENRAAVHSATLDYPRDQRRVMMRATVRGTNTLAEPRCLDGAID